jgi:macrolide-specific efflux system membrane fusion protein
MRMLSIIYAAVLSLAVVVVSYAADKNDDVLVDSALLQLIEQVDVPARTSGTLSSLDVVEGNMVTRGTNLAQIDDRQAKLNYYRAATEVEFSAEKSANDAAVRSAQRALTFAESEFERLERASVAAPGSVSLSELEQARLNADQATLDIEQAQHDLRLNQLTEKLKKRELELTKYDVGIRKIVSPLNGVVVEVLRHAGEWVEPGDKVARIVRIDRLRAEGLVHVGSIGAVLQGSPAIVIATLPGQQDLRCSGEVVFVSPEVNPVNGLVRISVEFDNPQNQLKPGLRARIAIPPAISDLRRPGAADARF